MRCKFGFRCTNSPYGRCDDGANESVSLLQLASLFLSTVLLFGILYGACRYVCQRAPLHTQPIVGHPVATSGGRVVASPLCQTAYAPQNDGMMSGLVTGMVLGTILSDLDEPPAYAEATEAGYEPDAA